MIVRQYTRQVVAPIVLICSCLFLLMLVQKLSSLSVWDDAYMFVRYTDNLLTYGNLSWNPGEVNTYGLTSPAFLLIVIPLRLIFSTAPALVMILSSLLSGLATLLTMMWLLRKLIQNPVHQLMLWIVIMVSIVVASESLATHLTSGMDTMFTIWLLTFWVGLLYTSDDFRLMGVVGGLLFGVRPDVMILVGVIPLILLISRTSYSQVGKYVLGVGITLFTLLTITGVYFGSPLPLSFYAKNFPIYSQEFYQHYQTTSWDYFLEFLRTTPYLLALMIIGGITQFRTWTWQDKGLLLGSVLYCLYHIVLVVPIMGFSERFFYPMFPILVILAARNLSFLLTRIPNSFVDRLKNYPLRILFIPLLLAPALVRPMPIVVTLVQYTQPDVVPTVGIGHFDLQIVYDYLYYDNWYRLDELSKLNNDLILASTEIGLPGVMNPEKRIIDLAGLNQPNFALNGFSADWLMDEQNQPDWIYMPFPHYEGMWFELFDHLTFQTEYAFFYAQSLGTSMDVAIKRDSVFYSDMLEIMSNYE